MCEPHRHSRSAALNKYFKRETRPHPHSILLFFYVVYTVLFGVNEPSGLYAIRFIHKTYTRTHIIQVLRARRREKNIVQTVQKFRFHCNNMQTHIYANICATRTRLCIKNTTFLVADWEMREKMRDFCRPFVSRWSCISHRVNKLLITQKRFYHAKLRFFEWIFALMMLVMPGFVYAAIQFR